MKDLLIAVVIIVGAGCRNPAPQKHSDTAAAGSPLASSVDSVARVRVAAALFGAGDGDSMTVERYLEDTAGTLVSFVPLCPPPGGCAGGGGLVRVDKQGRAHIVERYR